MSMSMCSPFTSLICDESTDGFSVTNTAHHVPVQEGANAERFQVRNPCNRKRRGISTQQAVLHSTLT